MLNKLILFLASANVAVVGYGQARLVAQVNDGADNALPFAQVSVNDGVFGTQADEHGQFTLAGLRPGDAPLRIVLVGYRTLDTVITLVAGDNRMTFALDPDDHLLRDVEVSAIRAGDRAPFARSTVTKAEIRRSNTGVDLPYLLDGQPSTV
ncbi:MAG TPA: carboxypeptidase-like regulatory domain-containing protein, partial [Flavobacteriales bacterium]|nr:carboxypeptidase-like regulatory domain-containing protein [Flavobacteriales bacterium]